MTDLLYGLLVARFGEDQISVYEAYERLYCNLHHRAFVDAHGPNITSREIGEIARRVFDDVPFTFGRRGLIQHGVFFEPDKMDGYSQGYSCQDIEISEPFIYPVITISTGNRGQTRLHERQRQKYFGFTVAIWDRFVRNATEASND